MTTIFFLVIDPEHEQYNHLSTGQFAQGRSKRRKRGMLCVSIFKSYYLIISISTCYNLYWRKRYFSAIISGCPVLLDG